MFMGLAGSCSPPEFLAFAHSLPENQNVRSLQCLRDKTFQHGMLNQERYFSYSVKAMQAQTGIRESVFASFFTCPFSSLLAPKPKYQSEYAKNSRTDLEKALKRSNLASLTFLRNRSCGAGDEEE